MSEKKELFILGSGESINSLTKQERNYINKSKLKISFNKYYAFFELSGIEPNHIYFYDTFSRASISMLRFIIAKANKNRNPINFILKSDKNIHFTSNRLFYYLGCRLKKYNVPKVRQREFFYIQSHHKIELVRTTKMMDGEIWAKSINEPLFHFRGSLTSVLNYVSICYPGYNIKLVGVDFNSSKYFFDEEMEKLDFETSDWTSKLMQKEKKHFSIIEYEGTTMLDKFGYVVKCLSNTNKIYSCNENSELVKKKLIKYKPVIS